MTRAYLPMINRLKEAGLRPTRQRLALAKLLFEKGNRHVSAENLHKEALAHQMPVSLATVYNSLNQFTRAGLLREVAVDAGRSYFDTNTGDHHHFFHEETGELEDILIQDLHLDNLPPAPKGSRVSRVDVIIRIAKS